MDVDDIIKISDFQFLALTSSFIALLAICKLFRLFLLNCDTVPTKQSFLKINSLHLGCRSRIH